MQEVKLTLNGKNHGHFTLLEDGVKAGEMVVAVSGSLLTVYHTEVFPGGEGKGLAKIMLDQMVAYARKNNLQVMPLCAYVHAQFKRHPDVYAGLWKKESE